MISSIQQYIHNPDGTISLKGRPGVRVQAIQEQDLERPQRPRMPWSRH